MQPADQAVRDEILSRVTSDGHGGLTLSNDVHFMAHSKGALSVERGIAFADKRLLDEGYSKEQIAALNSHIGVETFGGASYGMPEGTKVAAYYNTSDAVPVASGEAPVANSRLSALWSDGGLMESAHLPIGWIQDDNGNVFDMTKGKAVDRGTLVQTPIRHDESENDVFVGNHDAPHYVPYREKFADALDGKKVAVDNTSHTPAGSTFTYPSREQLQDKVDALASTDMWLPPVKKVVPYDGGAHSGQLIKLDATHFAQNIGRGEYQVIDANAIARGNELQTGDVLSYRDNMENPSRKSGDKLSDAEKLGLIH
jgi:hypothetical protein